MNEIPYRLKQLRLKYNLKQAQLADILNVGHTTLSETEQGVRPLNDKVALALIRHFKYDIENDIYFDDISNIDLNNKNKIKIPFVRQSIAAGTGIYEDSNIEIEPLTFDRRFLPHGLNVDNIYCFPVSGDSMTTKEGKGILDGDILFVDITYKNITDGIYVIEINNELRVKRLIKNLDNSITIKSDNPLYPTEIFNIETSPYNLTVIGRVVFNITRGNNLNKFNNF